MSGTSSLAAIAWRNLWRNRRRTLITLSGMAFGILLAILFTGLGDSSYSMMIDYAARLGGGHVSLQHPEYAELPSLKKTVRNTDEMTELALETKHVTRVNTRISGATMLSTAANSQGAFFIALDPTREDLDTFVALDSIAEGELFKAPDEKGIVLGATLAENLDTKLGRKVVFTVTDREGEIVSGLARVKGIIKSGAPTVDGGMALLSIEQVRELLGYEPDEATHVAIFVDDNRVSDQVRDHIATRIPEEVTAASWHQTQAELAGFIAMKRSSGVIMEVIILLLVSAGIFNTLFVSVMERLREFGIMTAIGFSPAQLFSLVMWESLWLGLMGLFAGAVVTAYPYYTLSTAGFNYAEMAGEGVEAAGVAMDPIIYVSIYPEKLITIGLVVVIATLAAGLYPAWKAGRVAPAEAIKLV